MSTAQLRLMLRETFRYRRARGCTRADASCVAWAMRLKAELTSVEAAAIEDLLFTMCTESRGTVSVEVSCT
jgi:hypothetical protein